MNFGEDYFRTGNYTGFKSGPTGKYFWSRRFYAKLLQRERKDGRLIEVGCGLGHLLSRLETTFETYGIDVSEHAVAEASKVATRSQIRQLRAESIGEFGASFFDVVVAIHVIEHLRDPAAFVSEVSNILRPGGLFFMVTPNLRAPLRRWKGQNWHGFRDPTHISLKEPEEWLRLLRSNGFRIKKTFGDGMWDVPYVRYMPNSVQLALFGWPAAVQVLAGRPLLPVSLSESLVCLAVRP